MMRKLYMLFVVFATIGGYWNFRVHQKKRRLAEYPGAIPGRVPNACGLYNRSYRLD